MTLGVGIVGCGMIARFHARAVADTDGAELVGCYSRRPEQATAFAVGFGGRAYESIEALCNDDRVQVIAVCTPSGSHLEGIEAAAKAGKHVMVEKPLEVTVARCDQAIAVCQRSGVKLGVTLQSRFHRAAIELKRAVDDGRFGQISLADAYVKWFRSQQYYDSGAWRGTWSLDGGGALMNQAIHTVDLLLWLMGDVEEVFGRTALRAHQRIEVEDTAVGVLRFKSGALGVIEASTASYPGVLKRIEISGSHGMAVLEEEDLQRWQFAQERQGDDAIREELAAATRSGGGAADPAAIGHHGHAAAYRDLVTAIEQGRTPLIHGGEARRSVALITALYEAARSGHPVRPSL
jgi:UDP-N-acetyl-2-amino-2-deoxyglucuronate dehydrogenase